MNIVPAGRSIQRTMLLWVLAALLLGATLLVGGSWWVLDQEMGEVFEDNLKQVALAVAHHQGSLSGAPQPPRLTGELPRVYEEYGKFEFVTAVWTLDGQRIYVSDPTAHLPFRSRSGPSEVASDGERWHMYTIVLQDRIVQAAQRATERETLARESASELVGPALALLVVLAVLLAAAIQRGLAPLSVAAADVAGRSADTLHPIDLQAHPRELHLLVRAINGLMARLGAALAAQRHLVSDAAHELRTPIAALRLQLQLLERAPDAAARRLAQEELAAGIDRAQHLVEQLLQLSRLGPEAPPPALRPVSLRDLARECVARFSARAEAAGIDLGAEARGEPVVQGDASQLTTLLNSLVDNALRHTPEGGRIDVCALEAGGTRQLQVRDTGPGIAPAERARVFDRFYRGADQHADAGSGLGLAIVKAVVDRHGAQVALDDASGGGLQVTVSFSG